MIPITPDIMGPGIEEEYEDAMERIVFLLNHYRQAGWTPTNENFYGRMLYQLMWLQEMIEKKMLPIPVDPSYIATLKYAVRTGEVCDTDEVSDKLGELARILKGPGLLKPRHYPVIVAMIRDFIKLYHKCVPAGQERPLEAAALADWHQMAARVEAGTMQLPVPRKSYPNWMKPTQLVQFDEPVMPDGWTKTYDIMRSVFGGWRPPLATKPPLPAPVPGLAAEAPDFTPIRDALRKRAAEHPDAPMPVENNPRYWFGDEPVPWSAYWRPVNFEGKLQKLTIGDAFPPPEIPPESGATPVWLFEKLPEGA